MTILVTGGAGYIGSHVVHNLIKASHKVLVLDDLSTGFLDRVPKDCQFIEYKLGGEARNLKQKLSQFQITSVIHLAALKSVQESMQNPKLYSKLNVGGLEELLEALDADTLESFVFSSSASVYGNPKNGTVSENSETQPISTYGITKLEGERLVDSYGIEFGLNTISLRYFNVAGALNSQLADRVAINLFPIILQAHKQGQTFEVFGGLLETKDGSCVRDYIHVQDLARLHIAALMWCKSDLAPKVINIGSGIGTSVLEVLAALSNSLKQEIKYEISDPREGDPVELVANNDLLMRMEPEFEFASIQDIADSTVKFL
jgi:UDP-glucose 4-epimerase